MTNLVLATRNLGKIKEIRSLLSDLPLNLLTLSDFSGLPEVVEDQETFAGNATKKASAIARACGEITLADDSGLEVEALGGLPGVRSARFAGPGAGDQANNRLLLKMLTGCPPEERKAVFRCVIAIYIPGGKTYLVKGNCPGRIAEQPRGTLGFGYDPLFYYEPAGLTMAEMDPQDKNLVSHRGQALRRAYRLIKYFLFYRRPV
ncbi:MAG TPA: XTP/dITP diphosphatase [Firmicutes bacterium]|nr:XTP/dITP diphosphatase [Bacillota bacterium]